MGFAPPFVPHPGNPFGVFAASGNGGHQSNLKVNKLYLQLMEKIFSYLIYVYRGANFHITTF